MGQPIRAGESMKDSKYDEWEVKDAHRTLIKAEEIKKDPKMLKLVKALNKKKKEAIKTIDDLHAAAKRAESKGN